MPEDDLRDAFSELNIGRCIDREQGLRPSTSSRSDTRFEIRLCPDDVAALAATEAGDPIDTNMSGRLATARAAVRRRL